MYFSKNTTLECWGFTHCMVCQPYIDPKVVKPIPYLPITIASRMKSCWVKIAFLIWSWTRHTESGRGPDKYLIMSTICGSHEQYFNGL